MITTPEVEVIVAPNPGPMTLEGTNSYVVGAEPAIVIDPGPADAGHVERIEQAARTRGGVGLVVLTHSHADHADAAELLGLQPAPLQDGDSAGSLTAVATPGHAADHLCFLLETLEGRAAFSGDLVLGEGYSFVPPREHGGSLADYLDSLRRLRELGPAVLYPGHGPPIAEPDPVIDDYIEHRLDRERRLLAALERGERSRSRLLAEVWDDVPADLREAAAIVMQAHLEKLEAEGRLPPDIKD